MEDLTTEPPMDRWPILILGIQMRSGTNFLCNLLRRHPACASPGKHHVWEDYLLYHADVLRNYARKVCSHWGPQVTLDQDRVLQSMGAALLALLHRYGGGYRLLLKTPFVDGLELFPRLWPRAFCIVLVRDCCDLAESSHRSFGTNYESAMRAWARAAQRILDLCDGGKPADPHAILVRFEDLVQDPERELIRIFEHVHLPAEAYDFAAATQLPVLGSSETRADHDTVHWKPVQKSSAFNPVNRAASWPRYRRLRYAHVAGAQAARLGYDVPAAQPLPRLAANVVGDTYWHLRELGKLVRRTTALSRHRRFRS